MKSYVLLFLFLLGSNRFDAQTNSISTDQLIRLGTDQMIADQLSPAEASLKLALAQAQAEQDPSREVTAYYRLSILSEIRKQPDSAEKYLLWALNLTGGTNHPVPSGPVLALLHSFYSRNSNARKDADILKRIVETLLANPGASSTRLCIYSRLLSQTLFKIKDYQAAEESLRSLISLPYLSDGKGSCDSNAEKLLLAQTLEREGKKDESKLIKSSISKPVAEPDFTFPRLVSKDEPKMPPLGLKARINGVSLLVVEIDATGRIHDAEVVVPLGFGCDENALEAVKLWKFKPATRAGNPVSKKATIEVSFRTI